MKKIFFFLFIATCSLSLHSMTIQTKATPVGMNWTMVTNSNEKVGFINSIDSNHLAIYSSIVCDDKSKFAPELYHLITAVKAFDAQYNVQDAAAIGCLYVRPEYRGQGYAHELVAKACGQLLAQGTKKLLLTPDPFEYVHGIPVLLQNKSEYDLKKALAQNKK